MKPETYKTQSGTATLIVVALFIVFAVLFFLPVDIPHKMVLPLMTLCVASVWMTQWQITAALLFSALGDWFGTCNEFMPQMGSFAVAHIFYIWFFIKRYLTKVEHDRKLTLRAKGYLGMILVCIAAILTVFYLKIFPCTPEGPIRVGVCIYAALISTMLLAGLLQRSTLYALGAVLFVFSDFILAWNKFVEPIPYRNYLVLGTYFAAQLLLFIRSTSFSISSLRRFRF